MLLARKLGAAAAATSAAHWNSKRRFRAKAKQTSGHLAQTEQNEKRTQSSNNFPASRLTWPMKYVLMTRPASFNGQPKQSAAHFAFICFHKSTHEQSADLLWASQSIVFSAGVKYIKFLPNVLFNVL